MRQGAAHGCLAGAGRTVEQNAAVGAQTKTIGELIVLQRQGDIDLEAAQHVVHPFQVLQVHLLDIHFSGASAAAYPPAGSVVVPLEATASTTGAPPGGVVGAASRCA